MLSQPMGGHQASSSRRELWEFRCVLIVTFMVCLLLAVVSRCLPWRWGRKPAAGGPRTRSVISEAKAAAHTIAPLAFMG